MGAGVWRQKSKKATKMAECACIQFCAQFITLRILPFGCWSTPFVGKHRTCGVTIVIIALCVLLSIKLASTSKKYFE